MSETEIAGHTYRLGQLDARRQLHVARRLAGLPISVIIGAATDGGAVADAVRDRAQIAGFSATEISSSLPRLLPSLSLRSLGMLSDADCDYVVNTCLSVCKRQQGANGNERWAEVWNAASGMSMFADIGLDAMMELTVQVLRENLGSFFGASLSNSLPPPTMDQPSNG